MNKRIMLFNTAVLFALLTCSAVAEPKNGFSLNGGLTSSNRDCGVCDGADSSGLSFGMDYQYALSGKMSFNPFLMISAENSSSVNLSETHFDHGILGAQLRYWHGDVFFGGHLGIYTEVISGGSLSQSGSGIGAGLVAGWEMPEGGWYLMGQLDSATMKYSGIEDIKTTALRYSVGYRWK
jgi:hypothetical protein